MNIELTEEDRIRVGDPKDLYGIMQRILLRENKIDQEKEHFWIVGLNTASVILYIELVSMGSANATLVEPMNVFRVAILKGATSVIAVHNHPGGNMDISDGDLDCTDRLIQVGRIINIVVADHLVISTKSFISMEALKIMDKLKKSVKYVPTFQLINEVREEERQIREKALDAERQLRFQIEEQLKDVIIELAKVKSIEEIAELLKLNPRKVKELMKAYNKK